MIFMISNIHILKLAYKHVNGWNTTGHWKSNDFVLNWFAFICLSQISQELKAGTFKFVPPTNKKTKVSKDLYLFSLRFSSQIVESAMFVSLFYFFSQVRHDSYLSKQNIKKDSLFFKKLKYNCFGASWVFKGQISQCHVFVNYKLLLRCFRKWVSCKKTITLVKHYLTNFLVMQNILVKMNWTEFKTTPLQSLFCDIYLLECDLFVLDFKWFFCKEVFFLKKTRKLKFNYIRFLDNIILATFGSKKQCEKIRFEVQRFLAFFLGLSFQKKTSHVCFLKGSGFLFLGFFFTAKKKKANFYKSLTPFVANVCPSVRLLAPISIVLKKAVEVGFLQRKCSKRYVATACCRIIYWKHANILRFYNKWILSVWNYYAFVDNIKRFGLIFQSLRHSCALTLALKFKLRRRSKVFKVFGKTLQCPETRVRFSVPVILTYYKNSN